MGKSKLLWALVFSLALFGLPMTSAQAQENEEEGDMSGLEEILVTARRREENLQDVPVSIQAFSSTEMDLRGIERVEDVVAAAPNVMVSAGPSTAFNTFAMRGIPRAGFFVDDVWQQSSLSLSQRSVVELDRVEVLRGPQGTLYGRDTTGGAIRLYTKLPAREFGVRASATIGSYDRRDLALYADLPISDTLFSKISISSQDRDGYVDSITIDRSYGDIDDRNIRGDLLWVPSDKFQARLTIEDEQFEGSQANVTLQIYDPGAPGVDPGYIDPLGRSLFWVPNSQYYQLVGLQYDCKSHVMKCPGGEVGDLENKADATGPGIVIDLQNYNLKLDYSFSDNLSISSLTHYHEQKSWDYNNFTAAEIHYFSQGSSRKRDGWTQEIQINGENGAFNWMLGGYAWKENEFNHFQRWALWEFVDGTYNFNDSVWNSPECSSFFIPAFPGGPPQGALSGLIPCVQVPPSQDSMTSFTEKGYAFFGEITWSFAERWALTLGARYHDQKNTDRTELFAPNTGRRSDTPGQRPAGNPYISGGRTDERTNKFNQDTYRVALTNHITDDIMMYAGFAQGYNAGGISRVQIFDLDNNAINFDFPYKPEQINNYELGWRSDLLGHTLRLNATLFFTEWDDIQLDGTVTNPFTGVVLPTFVRTNAAKAEAKGAEFEITWLPSEHWQFDADVGMLDTKYTDIAEGSELTKDANFGMAPELQYSLGAQWNGSMSNGSDIILRLDYMYTSGYNRTYVPGDCSCRYSGKKWEQSGFGLLNARIVFRPSDKWELAIFGTNLTDERYTDGGFMSPLLQVDDGTIGRPIEWGASVRFEF